MADTTGFANICANLREGVFNQVDLDVLNTRFVEDRSSAIASMACDAVYIATENRLVTDVVRTFLDKARAEGNQIIIIWALHSQVHERVPFNATSGERFDRRRANATFNSTTRERLLTIYPDSKKNEQFGPPIVEVVIGKRYMVTTNLFLDINVVNGTTGVLVGLVFSADDPHPIRVHATRHQAATLQPQIPIALICVDEHFWKPEFSRLIRPIEGYPPRTIAIEALSSYLKLPNSGTRYLRSQLPLMSAQAFSQHKSQSMTIPAVVVDMSGRHFAANGTYVAITRVQSLQGLTIVGRKIKFEDFLVDQPCLQRIRAEYSRIQLLEPLTLQDAKRIATRRLPRRRAEFESFEE